MYCLMSCSCSPIILVIKALLLNYKPAGIKECQIMKIFVFIYCSDKKTYPDIF